MKQRLPLAIIFVTLFLTGCNKQKIYDENTCLNISNITLLSNSPVTIGQTIHFGTQEVDGYRIYNWVGPNNYWNQIPEDSIVNADLKNEGWYYLHLYNPTGCERTDSLYIDVELEKGTPSCTVGNNTSTYSNMGEDNYTTMRKEIDRTFSQKTLTGYSGIYSEITVYFHPHWRVYEPEDGIYRTTNSPVFAQTDESYNEINIAITKNSIYWSSTEGQNIYVSHIGSKLQIRFCNLKMGGNNGTSYITTVSGNLVEL